MVKNTKTNFQKNQNVSAVFTVHVYEVVFDVVRTGGVSICFDPFTEPQGLSGERFGKTSLNQAVTFFLVLVTPLV